MSNSDNLPSPVASRSMVRSSPPEYREAFNPFKDDGQHYWCTWDETTPEGKQRLARCIQAPDVKIEEAIGQTLVVCHAFGQIVSIPDEATGEVFQVPRTVLILLDGSTVSTCSESVPTALGWIGKIFGQPPWPKGLPIQVRQKRSRRGRVFYELEVVMFEATDKAAKGGTKK